MVPEANYLRDFQIELLSECDNIIKEINSFDYYDEPKYSRISELIEELTKYDN